jgi:fatty-acyl-CoA synthase
MPGKDALRKKGSIGLPVFYADIRIVDQDGKEMPPGERGEMVVKGPTLMSGYWNKPEETAKTIVDGVLHTGDVAVKDKDGFVYIVDRMKDMYRSGGENVYPAEMEKILLAHPKISQVAIIGVPDEKWTEVGKAFVLPKEGQNISKEEVLEFLRGKVAKFKIPVHVEFVDSLPMTSAGKVKKVELKKKYGSAAAPGSR